MPFSVSKKSFCPAEPRFSDLKKFGKSVLLNAQGVLTPCTHSPLLSLGNPFHGFLTVSNDRIRGRFFM